MCTLRSDLTKHVYWNVLIRCNDKPVMAYFLLAHPVYDSRDYIICKKNLPHIQNNKINNKKFENKTITCRYIYN